MPFTKEQIEKLGLTYKEGMTDEEVFTAMSEAKSANDSKVAELTGEVSKHKDLLSKRNTEIAELKRKEQEKLSDEEKEKIRVAELEKNYNNLMKEHAIAEKEKGYIEAGYPSDLAKKIAEAEIDGKSTIEFHKQFLSAHDEKIKAEIMKGNPTPTQKGDPNDVGLYTKENYKAGKIGYAELDKLSKENPALFDEITKD